jgi:hypothetical protein
MMNKIIMAGGSSWAGCCMKTFLLTLCAVAALNTSAFANMWDTHALSDARYAKPTTTEGFTGITSYAKDGWMILEWFNKQGHVEAIEYYQMNGNAIIPSQIHQLCEANRMLFPNWSEISDKHNNSIWLAKVDSTYFRFELSWDTSVQDKPLQRVLLSTAEGFLRMDDALRAANAEHQSISSDLPIVNI